MSVVSSLERHGRRAVALIALVVAVALPLVPALGADPGNPGPPYPAPQNNRAVYDVAGVFRAATVASLEATIDGIETRTGAEVVVYTEVWPYRLDEATALSNALALMDQWGIGRRGFDDGLVILFELDPSRVHGQVQLYAGSGFRNAFLTDGERQAIYEQDMLPLLQAGDLDGAALVALRKVDAAATPAHAQELDNARIINALIGVGGGLLALFGLIGWTLFHWLRFGRDPVYTDSPSVLVPAPPEGMTAATATLVFDGAASRRTLTAAMLDLASRGEVAFQEEQGLFGLGRRKVSIELGGRARSSAVADLGADLGALADTTPVTSDPQGASAAAAHEGRHIAAARLGLAQRRPLSPAETYLGQELDALAEDETITSDDVPKLAAKIPAFERLVEDQAVQHGWFGAAPSRVAGRWRGLGVVEIVAGGLAVWPGFALPMSGLTLLGGGVIAAGLFTLIVAGFMPARTMAGAMQRAWLFAYRRTLEKTMAQARSMDQVVQEAKLDWLETPDQAVVWAVALGLTAAVEDVLARTVEDAGTGSGVGYLPLWYRGHDGAGLAGAGGGGGGGGSIFSGSGIPDVGGMFSALGTIGNAPSSSGSGGGGGFGGGGGGGGGGAGGGF